MRLTALDYYNLYDGNILEDPRYLRKGIKESNLSYQTRLKWSSYQNWAKRVVDTYLGYLLYNPPRIENERKEYDTRQIIISSAIHAMVGGVAYALVLPTGIKIYRCIDVEVGENSYRFKGANDELYVEFQGGEGTITNKAGEKESIYPEQIVEIYWNENKRSILADIAMIIIEIYNINSVLNTKLNMAQTWFLTGPQLAEGMEPEPYSYIPAIDGVQLQIVQPDVATDAAILRQEINHRIMQIGRLTGLEAELSDEIKFESGISKAFSMIDTAALVQILAVQISLHVNQIFGAYASLKGGKPTVIQLDPLLKPKDPNISLSVLEKYARFVNTPEAVKLAQKEATSIVMSSRTYQERDEVEKSIDKSSGVLENMFISFG